MILNIHISVLLLSAGIASDNLILAAMSRNTARVVKQGKPLLMLFMLLNIQMMAFIYGGWAGTVLKNYMPGYQHWFALFMLITMAVRMCREWSSDKMQNMEIAFGLDGFLGIACATSIYVFVLGLSLKSLQIYSPTAYLSAMSALGTMLLLGWYLGQFQKFRSLRVIQIIALLMMVADISILIYQTHKR
ncbi:MAG: manganese efflux pump [Chitinophagaceae bacterium]|nr:manganese efflux pump [Chitinophagaceae bacterium]